LHKIPEARSWRETQNIRAKGATEIKRVLETLPSVELFDEEEERYE
jgi:hypothetical protein